MRAQIHHCLLASLLALSGCDGQSGAKPAGEPAAAAAAVSAVLAPSVAPPAPPAGRGATGAGPLTRVADVSEVCMVNDQFMGRAQIPVVVDSKTYFGCCEMCKGRLARDASARVAKDPISGNPVDKSSAVIAKGEDGHVLYFENDQNLERFQAGAI